jgi:hypothetical protein
MTQILLKTDLIFNKLFNIKDIYGILDTCEMSFDHMILT